MTDKQAILEIISTNFDYCADLYEVKDQLTCINLCNSCSYRDVDESRYPCWQQRLADWILKLVPQLKTSKPDRQEQLRIQHEMYMQGRFDAIAELKHGIPEEHDD